MKVNPVDVTMPTYCPQRHNKTATPSNVRERGGGGYNLILHDYIKNSYFKKKELRVEMIYEKLEESQTE